MSKILLVDDDQQTTNGLATILRVLGHEVLTALDATEGDRLTKECSPDLLLTDLMLPGVSGLDLIANVAKRPAHLYSCLVTGLADYKLLRQAMAAGAWSIMSKPYALPELLRVVNAAKLHASAGEGVSRGKSDGDFVLNSADSASVEEAVRHVAGYAAATGADEDTVTRRISIVAAELISNVQRHGGGEWVLSGHADRDRCYLRVEDHGTGFAWQRELSRRRTNWDGSKATGLQLVMALADDLSFEKDGRIACASVSKLSDVRKVAPADMLATA